MAPMQIEVLMAMGGIIIRIIWIICSRVIFIMMSNTCKVNDGGLCVLAKLFEKVLWCFIS